MKKILKMTFIFLIMFTMLFVKNVYAYTVKFNTNEGSDIQDITTSGGKITKPTNPTKEGYTFGGWYSDDTLTTLFDFNVSISSDTVLYAKWNELIKEVRIYSTTTNAYEGLLPSFDVTTTTKNITILPYGNETVWVNNISLNKNYWNTFESNPEAVAGNTHYGLRLHINLDKNYKFNSDVKIYFNDEDITSKRLTYFNSGYYWGAYLFIDLGTAKDTSEVNKYTVKFDTAGGSIINDTEILENNKVNIPSKPVKDGYTFLGWYEDATYVNSFDFDKTKITKNITIYAKWGKNINDINVNLDKPIIGNKVVVKHNNETNYDYQDEFVPEVSTNSVEFKVSATEWVMGTCNNDLNDCDKLFEGTIESNTYYYAKIYITANNGYALTNDTLDNITVNGVKPDEIFTVYNNTDTMFIAKVKTDIVDNKYTITFNTNGGNNIDNQIVLEGNKVTMPEDPVKEDYTFVGWSLNNAIVNENTGVTNGEFFNEDTSIDSNLILVANWKKNYKVTYNTGSVMPNPNPVIVVAGDTLEYPVGKVIPAKVGTYLLEGFYLDKDFKVLYLGDEPITENKEIYVKWNQDTITEDIKEVNITLTAPRILDSTKIAKDSDDDWDWSTQTNSPVASVSHDALYEIDGTYWIMGYEGIDYDTPFVGTFEKGKTYKAEIWLNAVEGYSFASDCIVRVNGELVDTIIDNFGDTIVVAKEISPLENNYKINDSSILEFELDSNEDLVITADGDINKFIGLEIDNVLVDKENYTVKSGSTIATLKASFLNTLDKGTHSIKFLYNDGDVTTNFKVTSKLANGNTTNPQTGDLVYLWIILLSISVLGLAISALKYKSIK